MRKILLIALISVALLSNAQPPLRKNVRQFPVKAAVWNDSIPALNSGTDNLITVNGIKNFVVNNTRYVDTLYKNATKDSVVFKISGTRYAIKDEVGTSVFVDSSKWQRVNNKLQPKNTIDSVLLHKKLILDDYKNQTIEVPEYQTKIATSLSYNNIFNEIQAEQACDASGFTTLPTINTINGSMYNFSPTTCGLGEDVWELSLNFPLSYTGCLGSYIDEVIVRTVGVSNTEGGYGTCLKVDGTNTEYNGQPIYSEGTQNAPFDYYFIDTTNRVSISSILATFLWEGTADLGLDGMEVILKIGGCENKYIVLSTDANGLVKLDTLPDFITADDLPAPLAPENFANTDLTFTGNRTHNGNGNDLEITNLNNSTISANNSIENIGVSKTIQAQDNIILSSSNGNGSNVTTIQSNSTSNQITDNSTGYTLSHTEGAQQVFYNYTNIPNTVSNFSIIPERGNVHYNLESGLSGGTEYETIQTRDTTIELTVKNSDGTYGSLRIEPNSFEIKTKSNQNSPTATAGQVLTLIDQYTGECDWADAGGGNNFANTDLELTGDRTHTLDGHSLTIFGEGNQDLHAQNSLLYKGNTLFSIQGHSFFNEKGIYINGSNGLGNIEDSSTVNNPAVTIIGTSQGAGSDIQIYPVNNKLEIKNLNTDNTATQVMGKDANGYSVWLDKDSLVGTDNSIYNSDGTIISNRLITFNKNIKFDGLSSINTTFEVSSINASVGKGINLMGTSDQETGTAIVGNSNPGVGLELAGVNSGDFASALLLSGKSYGLAPDIRIRPLNGKLAITDLPTDNTAPQLLGKDANNLSVWVDKSSIAGSFAGITTVNAGSGLTKINDSTLALGGVLTNYLSIDGTTNSQRIDIAGKDNNVGIQITGLSSNIYSAAQFVGANSGSGADIEIAPINGKLFISSLPTYNDATQVLGLNNLGNCAWVAKNPVGTTAQRPITPIQGMERFNSTIVGKELYDGTNWIILSGTWTTGARPTGIGAGSTGFNTTLLQKEYWNGATWVQY